MSNEVRQFFGRISDQAILDVFAHFEISPPVLSELTGRKIKRINAAVDAAFATDEGRGLAEALSSEIIALSSKSDLAENALRSACENSSDLLKLLEDNVSLEERCWRVWKQDHQLIDRARNITMSYHWRDGRYHAAFTVADPSSLSEDLAAAVATIQTEVQSIEGGRKAQADRFSYHEHLADLDDPDPALIHHVAIYLEKPARALMEFRPGTENAEPVISRHARELAITYNTRTGCLDVSGKGIGGQKVLANIAQMFSDNALEGSELAKVKRNELKLDRFLALTPPAFANAPEGFLSAQVYELRLRKAGDETSRAVFRTDGKPSANERMKEMGVRPGALKHELVAGVTLQFMAPVESDIEDPRKARVVLNWPAGVSYENATISEQRSILAWLKSVDILD